MARVAVIGSNSFSGSDFIDLLLEDEAHEVIGISRSPEKAALYLPYTRHGAALDRRYRFHQLDLNHDLTALLALLDREQPEYVVNFAALLEPGFSWVRPEEWFETNVIALVKLGDHLRRAQYLRRYVHISTPEVYGSCEGVVTEDAPFNPSTPYAASKAAGDLFLSTLVKAYRFPLVTIRSTNVYGSHQQLFRIIPRTMIYNKLGRRIELHGGGHAVKSFIHIRDVSRGELAAMLHATPGAVYHLSPESGAEVRDVVRAICARMGRDFGEATVDVGDRLGQDAAYVIDSAKARRELQWRPQISLEQGLDDVLAWVERHWPALQHEPLEYRHRA